MSVSIVTMGTSITAGIQPSYCWQFTLGNALRAVGRKDVSVYNFGISSASSAIGLANIAKPLFVKPDAVVIEYTTNDAYLPYGLTTTDCRNNANAIIAAFRAANPAVGVALFIPNPPYPGSVRESDRPHEQDYNDVYRDVARTDPSITLIDTWSNWASIARSEYEQDIHPSLAAMQTCGIPSLVNGLRPYVL